MFTSKTQLAYAHFLGGSGYSVMFTSNFKLASLPCDDCIEKARKLNPYYLVTELYKYRK